MGIIGRYVEILEDIWKIWEKWLKFSRSKSISSIEDNFSFTLVIYLFSSVSLQLPRKTIFFYCEKNVH